jgi:chlorite dismutase
MKISETTGQVDLSEKGLNQGQVISLDRRLFMKFNAFSGQIDEKEIIKKCSEINGAIYRDINDPNGIGLLILSEDPAEFIKINQEVLSLPPFSDLQHKHEFDMLGRTYSIGYENDLEEVLINKPKNKIKDPNFKWCVWYPLRREKKFYVLPADKQKKILGEHGNLAKRYGYAGLAVDIRLACHGLDKQDNDFVIGLLGPDLHPLSAVVQEMRQTEQTAHYLESLGPFFVGLKIWENIS